MGVDMRDLNEAERRCVPAMRYTPWGDVARRTAGCSAASRWRCGTPAAGRRACSLRAPAGRRGARPTSALTEYFSLPARRPGGAGRGDAAGGRPLLRADGRRARRRRLRGQGRDGRARRGGGDGARGARRDRPRPRAAPRRQRRLDRADRPRRAAPARPLRRSTTTRTRSRRRRRWRAAAGYARLVLVAPGRPAQGDRAGDARHHRLQPQRVRRHPPHGRVLPGLRAVRRRLPLPLPARPASAAPPTCTCRPPSQPCASRARRCSAGTPTT